MIPSVLAAEGGYQAFELNGGEWFLLVLSRRPRSCAIVVGFVLAKGVLAEDEGTPKMKEIAKAIQEGASAYLKRQFKTIAVILVPLAVVVFLTSTEVVQAGRRRWRSPSPSPASSAPLAFVARLLHVRASPASSA